MCPTPSARSCFRADGVTLRRLPTTSPTSTPLPGASVDFETQLKAANGGGLQRAPRSTPAYHHPDRHPGGAPTATTSTCKETMAALQSQFQWPRS